jgi:adenylyltransferase/sulfurtransferase
MRSVFLSLALALSLGVAMGAPVWATPQSPETSMIPSAQTKPFAAEVPTLSVQDLKARMAAHERFLLLDVREPDETAAGVIPGSTLMPLSTLSQKLESLPKDEPIYVYCRSGARSAKTTVLLRSIGYDKAYSLAGGYMAWRSAR